MSINKFLAEKLDIRNDDRREHEIKASNLLPKLITKHVFAHSMWLGAITTFRC